MQTRGVTLESSHGHRLQNTVNCSFRIAPDTVFSVIPALSAQLTLGLIKCSVSQENELKLYFRF
jgi:hypothetical protein